MFQICDGAEKFKEKDEKDKMPKSQQRSSPPPSDKPKESQKEYVERPRPNLPRGKTAPKGPSIAIPGGLKDPGGGKPSKPPLEDLSSLACDPWTDCPPPAPSMNPKEIDKYYEKCCDSLVRVSRRR